MSIFNGLTFDGINSLDYGVYITGEAVYNTPERDVESIEIPGRSGDYLQDNGRWKNIEVTYKAGVFGDDQSEFASKIRNFRNALASRIGYKRITDTYNPNEYRLGAFVKPVEVEPKSMNRTGEFDIIFNCKPQRWLTSGEDEVTVETGDVVTNPTPYDASPLLMVEGYGNIGFNGYEIDIVNEVFGDVILNNTSGTMYMSRLPKELLDVLESGDSITLNPSRFVYSIYAKASGYYTVSSVSVSSDSGTVGSVPQAPYYDTYRTSVFIPFSIPALTFVKDTPQTFSDNIVISVTVSNGSTTQTTQLHVTLSAILKKYANNDDWFIYFSSPAESNPVAGGLFEEKGGYMGNVIGHSTRSILGNPTYIDCDLGEAYKEMDGQTISLNRYIDLGSDLPVLAPGANAVTYENTITELKIVPRWWIL